MTTTKMLALFCLTGFLARVSDVVRIIDHFSIGEAMPSLIFACVALLFAVFFWLHDSD